MKAIQAADRAGYEALRLVEIPPPQSLAGQALVRVTSAGVTRWTAPSWPACTRLPGSFRSCRATRARAS
jgi:hypothetical protein